MAVLVAAGYLIALGGTSSGQGWQLLSHLASAHADAPPAPALVPEADADLAPVLQTLRSPTARSHEHGHTHGHEAEGHAHGGPVRFGRPVRASTSAPAEGVHEHDGVSHSHDAPAPDAPAVVTVSVDHHRLPTPSCVPPSPSARLANVGDPRATAPSVDVSVETPPPIRSG